MAKAFAAAVIGALAVGVLGMASIGNAAISAKVTVKNETSGVYEGTVKSGTAKCEKRKIYVFHDENGDHQVGDDFEIGNTKTDSAGRWSMSGRPQAPADDNVIAVATKKGHGKNKCKREQGETKALSD
jgi:hypothetical protein